MSEPSSSPNAVRLTTEQEAVVDAPRHVAVTASAGTGKTLLLVERYLQHLYRDQLRPLQIVAVTYTERAADELRERLRARLRTAAAERPEWLAELDAAPIGTIHGLCARICRAHPQPAGVAPGFSVLGEEEGVIWRLDALDDVLAETDQALFEGPDALPFSAAREALATLLTEPRLGQAALDLALDKEAIAQRGELVEDWMREATSQPAWYEVVGLYESADWSGYGKGRAELKRREFLGLAARCSAGDRGAWIELDRLTVGRELNWDRVPPEDRPPYVQGLADIKELCERVIKFSTVDPEVDARHQRQLGALRELFGEVLARMNERKRIAGLLDFADLEVGALQALADDSVRLWCARRWQALLLDECQDINPVQAELVAALRVACPQLRVALVGDEKQSIYGFRGARPEAFASLRQDLVAADPTTVSVDLTTCFRTHGLLVDAFNGLFDLVFNGPDNDRRSITYVPQTTLIAPAPSTAVCFELASLAVRPDAPPTDPRSGEPINVVRPHYYWAEGAYVAERIYEWVEGEERLQVHATGHDGGQRDARWEDIAVLVRTWNSVDRIADSLAALGIPFMLGGGASLLATTEARDGRALLDCIADPTDRIALAAVLRGPCFTISDPTMVAVARRHYDLEETAKGWPELAPAARLIPEWRQMATYLSPSQLLETIDDDTGYSAVVANLPMGGRRLADWQAFVDWVRQTEVSSPDLFHLVRRLRRLVLDDIPVKRPAQAGANAVSIQTIHSAKGLEWPIVVVPSLSRGASGRPGSFTFDHEVGAALTQYNRDGAVVPTFMSLSLALQSARRSMDETRRLFYVAATRAKDHLLLTTPVVGGAHSMHAAVGEAIDAVIVDPLLPQCAKDRSPRVWLSEETIKPRLPRPLPPLPLAPALLEAVPWTVDEVAVTGLLDYATCPLRFRFVHVDGFPSALDTTRLFAAAASDADDAAPSADVGRGRATMLGVLTHLALEHDYATADQLPDDGTEKERATAIAYAEKFRTEAVFAVVNRNDDQRELPVRLRLGPITVSGIADRVGADYVLDFKTGRLSEPERFGQQLTVYAKALGKARAYLADLHHGRLYEFSAAELDGYFAQALRTAEALASGDFAPKPGREACLFCPFHEQCAAAGGQPACARAEGYERWD